MYCMRQRWSLSIGARDRGYVNYLCSESFFLHFSYLRDITEIFTSYLRGCSVRVDTSLVGELYLILHTQISRLVACWTCSWRH
jgi:hypothetical protein